VPGYYFHLQPGHSFLAAGKYNPEPGELLKIRTAIANHPDQFLKILRARSFQKCFGEIHGQKLKTAPKGFPKDHPAIEYLKLKNFLAFLELRRYICPQQGIPHLRRQCFQRDETAG
jgi:uncharacterized protein (TIGR02453 family)